jgi:hypothetical protein
MLGLLIHTTLITFVDYSTMPILISSFFRIIIFMN